MGAEFEVRCCGILVECSARCLGMRYLKQPRKAMGTMLGNGISSGLERLNSLMEIWVINACTYFQ